MGASSQYFRTTGDALARAEGAARPAREWHERARTVFNSFRYPPRAADGSPAPIGVLRGGDAAHLPGARRRPGRRRPLHTRSAIPRSHHQPGAGLLYEARPRQGNAGPRVPEPSVMRHEHEHDQPGGRNTEGRGRWSGPDDDRALPGSSDSAAAHLPLLPDHTTRRLDRRPEVRRAWKLPGTARRRSQLYRNVYREGRLSSRHIDNHPVGHLHQSADKQRPDHEDG